MHGVQLMMLHACAQNPSLTSPVLRDRRTPTELRTTASWHHLAERKNGGEWQRPLIDLRGRCLELLRAVPPLSALDDFPCSVASLRGTSPQPPGQLGLRPAALVGRALD